MMKGFFTAINIFKFVANKREQNRQRKHDEKMGEIDIEKAKEEGRTEMVTTLARADALAAKNPQTVSSRIIKFLIGLSLVTLIGLVSFSVFLAGQGNPAYMQAIITFVQVMENSPNVLVAFATLLSVFVGGRALAAVVK